MTNMAYTEPLLDDEVDYIECGIEHPRLEGNLCVNSLNHNEHHEDAAGNIWTGQDWINNR